MKIRYIKRAYSDPQQILNYLRARSPKGAANVLSLIETALDGLLEQPLMRFTANEARDFACPPFMASSPLSFTSNVPPGDDRHITLP